jgi:AcrR family transcriptional regulator
MPSPRLEQGSDALRDSLLDAAFEEFGARGYDAAVLDCVLSAARLGQAGFHSSCDDKADLAVAVIERQTARHMEVIGELTSPNTSDEFWAELKRIHNVVHDLERGGLARLLTSVSRHPEVMNRLGPLVEMWREKLTILWRRGQELGTVRTDLPVGVLITMAQGVRRAAASTKLPSERTASDGELAAFDNFYSALVQRMIELSRVPSEK